VGEEAKALCSSVWKYEVEGEHGMERSRHERLQEEQKRAGGKKSKNLAWPFQS